MARRQKRTARTARKMIAGRALSVILAAALACMALPALASEPGANAPAAPLAVGTGEGARTVEDLLAAGGYVEGEAVAVVRNVAAALRPYDASPLDTAKPLMELSAATYAQAVGAASSAEASDSDAAATLPLSSQGGASEDELSIVLVRDDAMTTEDLLHALADDPRVVSAEPNYATHLVDDESSQLVGESAVQQLLEPSGGSLGSQAASASGGATLRGQGSTSPDLSPFQWASGNSGETLVMAHDGSATQPGFDINEAGWNAGAPNATGTVAVFDTGIDYAHPDLTGVMWDGTPLNEVAAEGGRYGINVSGTGDAAEVMDDNKHGTHCAGIIAAAWNGEGVSGVANGVKLVAVKYLNAWGSGTLAGAVEGYEYLTKIAQTVNLKAVNNSWGGVGSMMAAKAAIAKLGEQGVVSVFASANDASDNDQLAATSSLFQDSPYVVVVNASDSTGKLAKYSNYGAFTTDLAAPGSGMLSTVPTAITAHYFPEAAPAQNVTFETYEGGRATCVDMCAGPLATEAIGSAESLLRYDAAGGSWRVGLAEMDGLPASELDTLPLASGAGAVSARTFNLKIDLAGQDVDDVAYFALRSLNPDFTMETTQRTYACVAGVEAVAADGSIAFASNDGTQAASARARMVDGWSLATLDVKSLLAEAGMERVTLDAEGRMTVRIVVLLPYAFSEDGAHAGDTLCFDCIGVGDGQGALGSYDVLSGTSMAAPVATGAAAVIAFDRGEPTAGELALQGGDALAASAAQRAARLRGSTRATAEFTGTCTSDGVLDLSLDDGGLAPSVTGIEGGDGATVIVTGCFFGDGSTRAAGSVMLDGMAATVVSWSDERVVVARPDGLRSGLVAVQLTAANGKATRFKGSVTLPDVGPDADVYEIDLPTPLQAKGFIDLDTALCVMEAMDGSLYLMGFSLGSGTVGLWRFDLGQRVWSHCAELPQEGALESFSMAAFQERLYLSCDDNEDQVMWCYDPAANVWIRAANDGVPLYASIVGFEGSLWMVGGIDEEGAPAGLRPYDPRTGVGNEVAALSSATLTPHAAASGGAIYALQGLSDNGFEASSLVRFSRVGAAWTCEDVSAALPTFKRASILTDFLAVAGMQDGVALVGLPKAGQDTAFLRDGTAALSPHAKTLSTERVYQTAAAVHEGYLYALGYSSYESDGMVFRATKLAADNPASPEGPSTAGSEGSGGPAKPLASTGDAPLPLSLAAGATFCALTAFLAARRTLRGQRRAARSSNPWLEAVS